MSRTAGRAEGAGAEAAEAPRRPIVVNAPAFDERNGGAIVLHRLVDRLRALGQEAYIHPVAPVRLPPDWPDVGLRRRWRVWRANRARRRRAFAEFRTHPALDAPRAPAGLALRGAIVVYPEIVSGNPLGARRVVRWLLHRPGFFRPWARFGRDEYTFFYQHAFREGLDWVDPDDLLRIRWIRDDVYSDRGLPREGACRLIRKGARHGTAPPAAGGDAVVVDEMSHEEKAEVFNRTRVLWCHDPYTLYLFYAALCGCIPVVVPPPGMTREQWRAREEDRWGIAYGEAEIPWAVATRGLMLERFERERREEDEMLRRFLRKLAARFP